MPSPWISEGSVTVAAGSKNVQGNGTAFLLRGAENGVFYCQGLSVPIEAVNAESGVAALTLAFGYPGAGGASLPYYIMPAPLVGQRMADALARVTEVLGRVQAGSFLQPNATGTLAQRAAFDGREQGFVYVRTDLASDYQVSVKRSSANANWGPWKSWLGAIGPQGPSGTNGTNGVGNYYDPSIEVPGKPIAGQEYNYLFVRSTTFASALAGARGVARIAGTVAPAVVSVLKKATLGAAGTQIGTLTFGTGSLTAVAAGTATTFAPGEIITFKMPSPQNATLTHLLFTLAGQRN